MTRLISWPNNPPKAGSYIIFPAFLFDAAAPNSFKVNPTLAAGDVKFSVDGGAYSNLSTLPVHNANGEVTVTLTPAETTGANRYIVVLFKDQAGAEWLEASYKIDIYKENTVAEVDADNTGINTIKAKTNLLPSSPAATGDAMTLTAAYDAAKTAASQASVTALGSPLQSGSYTAPDNAGIAAIKAKTDNLPASPASSGDVSGAAASVISALPDAPDNAGIAAIQAKTDNLPADPASESTVAAVPTSTWDKLLASLTTAGSIGKALADLLSVFNVNTRTLTETISITVTSPVEPDTGNINLVAGDDYYAADGRALSWESSDWPSLAGATVSFICNGVSVTASVSGTNPQTVTVELSGDDTDAIGTSVHPFSIRAALANGHAVTLVTGSVTA